MNEDDPKDKVFQIFDQWLPPELAARLKGAFPNPEDFLKYRQIRSNARDLTNEMRKIFEGYELSNSEELGSMILKNILSGAFDEMQSDLKKKRQKQINDSQYRKNFFLFFLLRIEEFYKVLRLDQDVPETVIKIEPVIKIANEFWPDQKGHCFESMAKAMVDNANKLIEEYFNPVLVNVGNLMGDTGLEKMMMGDVYKKLKEHDLVTKVLPFIFDKDIKLLRNTASHRGITIDIDTERIKLFEYGKLKKECTVGEIFDIIKRAEQIRTDFEIAKSALDFMIQNQFPFSFGKLKIEISKVDGINNITIKLSDKEEGAS